MKALQKCELALQAITAVLFLTSLYLVFMYVPNERVMGPVQRIFYFHVGAAFACYCSVAVVLAASLWFLATRSEKADLWNEAAGEVGFVFCSVVLASGMIWGHSAWNTWFNWEPRLVSFLLLWLIFLSFNLLRMFGDATRIGTHSAVLGILGAINVPIVVFSIKLLKGMPQLHPEVIENRGLKDERFGIALAVTSCTLILFQFVLLFLRVKLGFLRRRIREKEIMYG